MHGMRTLMLAAALTAGTAVGQANEVDDLDDDPEGHKTSLMHEVFTLGRGETVDPAPARMDLRYIDMMSQHHAGANTMSEGYLADERGTNPVLRKLSNAIIANQTFELNVLATARASVVKEPEILDLGFTRLAIRELGVSGLEHRWRFMPWPAPASVELAIMPGAEVTDYDVAFAKGMMIHHQAAVDMAWRYNRDPLARNRMLRLMNLDIIRAQRYEIGFLESVVASYPGDAAEVQPEMPLGMPMDHAMPPAVGSTDPHGSHHVAH